VALTETIARMHKDASLLSNPEGIINVPCPLKGSAFFPGGNGLYYENETKEHEIKYMIVGQDYDNEEKYDNLLKTEHQSEVSKNNSTWRNLLILLKDCNIPFNQCFFTNAFMGLRAKATKNTGRSILFQKRFEPEFKTHSLFFQKQVKLIKPKVIIAMGAHLPGYFARCYPQSSSLSRLINVRTFKQLDEQIETGEFHITEENRQIPVVFITHTSMYNRNVSGRMKYVNSELKGINFEKSILKNINK